MLISRLLDEPCPKCGVTGKYGNVSVDNNTLVRGCNNCKERIWYPLPEIRKKIIYLDQFFLSHAFRNQQRPFIDAANRIKEMAAKQLVVCPYSSVHTDETHLWRNDQQEGLYKFIKQTARGYKFKEAYEIKQRQLHRAFSAFLSDASIAQPIEEGDAFRGGIHKWDDFYWIDIRPILGDLDEMRLGKAEAIRVLVDLFPGWRSLTTSFEADVNMEARGYGRSLLVQYLQMVVNMGTGNLIDFMNTPEDTMYVESLLNFDNENMDIDDQLKRVKDFFNSSYFVSIPNIRISCGIMAVLRKMVKSGAYTNADNARRKLAGLFYDMECISVFGPYSDVIFIDRAMKQWCEDPDARLLEQHGTKIFSVENWDDFHSYLDSVEANCKEGMREALDWVYPGVNT